MQVSNKSIFIGQLTNSIQVAKTRSPRTNRAVRNGRVSRPSRKSRPLVFSRRAARINTSIRIYVAGTLLLRPVPPSEEGTNGEVPRGNFANLLNCQFTFATSGHPSASSPPFRRSAVSPLFSAIPSLSLSLSLSLFLSVCALFLFPLLCL